MVAVSPAEGGDEASGTDGPVGLLGRPVGLLGRPVGLLGKGKASGGGRVARTGKWGRRKKRRWQIETM
jgi:hypothetical protein